MSNPRQYSFVKYDLGTNVPRSWHTHFQQGHLEFSPHHRYIFLGEIPNLQGYCIVTDEQGKLYTGQAITHFIELTEDELETEKYAPVGYNYK